MSDETRNKTVQDVGFRWTSQRHQAAVLLAENERSDQEIAACLGIGRTTLSRWKTDSEFAAQVGDHIGEIKARMLRRAIAKKERRIDVLNALHEKCLTVIAERAGKNPGVAGDQTGLMVRQMKQIGSGRDAQVIEEFAVDASLIARIQSLHEQAAKELGQWQDKLQVEGLTAVVEIVGVDADAI